MSLSPRLDDLLELRHRANTFSLASRHRVNNALQGLYASVFRGQGIDFEENREYREGDEIRNMDWRVTARTGKPYLKIFREERERTVLLCVDVGAHMSFGTRGTFKSVQAARAAALLGWAADANRDRIGAILFGDEEIPLKYLQAGGGRRALWRMLRELTLESPRERVPAVEMDNAPLTEALDRLNRSAPTGSLVILIADLNRDCAELERPLGSLSLQREVVLVSIDDRADRELPAMGPIHFATSDGGLMEIDTDHAGGREAYAAEWRRRREAVEQMARRLATDLIVLTTEDDVHRTLFAGLMRRARRMGMRL